MLLRRILVGAGLLALLTYLLLRPPHEPVAGTTLVERNLPALGTWVSLTAYAEDPALQARARAAFDVAARTLGEFDERWRAIGDGALGRLNARLHAGEIVQVPADMRPLFERSFELMQASGGRFDPRLGALVGVWGFDDEDHYRSEPPPPAQVEAALAALRAAPAQLAPCADATGGGAACYGPAPGVRLDFGAIAKGYVVDQVAAELRGAGIDNFMINAGGNVSAYGRHGQRAWRIAVRHPRPAIERLLAIVEPENESVVTSGDYERFFEYRGRRYHHLLDPASGAPARGLQAVSVIAADGTLADAGSTAIFVAGPAHWRQAARDLGLADVLVVAADGSLHSTASMAARMRRPGDDPPQGTP